MSEESSRSPAATTDVAVGLEDALARIVASLRADLARELAAADAERRAAAAQTAMAHEQLRNAQKEWERWLEGVKTQRVELRGERGDRGADGTQGPPGADGADGQPGRDGRDGLPGVAGANGERGRDGLAGKDGKDGLGVADFDVAYDGRRKFTLRWLNGERLVERTFVMPIQIYCGSWENGKAYEANDVVTHGGQLFVAKCNTDKRPFGDDWQLASKRGADGKDGKEGKQGVPGPPGRDGRDLTQIGADGRRWG